MTTTQFK